MAGGPAPASDHMGAMGYLCPLPVPFHGMPAVKLYPVIVPVKEIQARALHLFKGQGSISHVLNLYSPGYDIVDWKYPV